MALSFQLIFRSRPGACKKQKKKKNVIFFYFLLTLYFDSFFLYWSSFFIYWSIGKASYDLYDLRLILEFQSWSGQECKLVIVQLRKTISFGIWVVGVSYSLFSFVCDHINRSRKFTNKLKGNLQQHIILKSGDNS